MPLAKLRHDQPSTLNQTLNQICLLMIWLWLAFSWGRVLNVSWTFAFVKRVIMPSDLVNLSYLVSAVLFILSLRSLSSAATSKKGVCFGAVGMILAIFLAIFSLPVQGCLLVVGGLIVGGTVGYFVAKKVDMTALPQLVAAFHSLVGLAAVFIAVASFIDPQSFSIASDTGSIPQLNLIEMSLGTVIGAITFAGSLIAFGKLQGIIGGAPLVCSCQHKVNALVSLAVLTFLFAFVDLNSGVLLLIIILLSLYLGIFLVLPIGGADMPVVVSMLNSYSGWAAAGIGFTLDNNLLIITGALVGASGAILSYIMCKGMNRSLISVILGGKVTDQGSGSRSNDGHVGNVKLCSFEDAAFIIRSSNSVVIVPGYGMAVAQAQHVIREISDVLKEDEILVRYAIHPVAGRMPGHMNVLLAEANIPYDDVLEIDEINHDFGNTDVAIVIGANDITNPSAKTDPTSSIYGMPILDVAKARTVLFVKRSLGAGYAGVDNPLFYQSNTMMILGDAKKVCESILRSLKESR